MTYRIRHGLTRRKLLTKVTPAIAATAVAGIASPFLSRAADRLRDTAVADSTARPIRLEAARRHLSVSAVLRELIENDQWNEHRKQRRQHEDGE